MSEGMCNRSLNVRMGIIRSKVVCILPALHCFYPGAQGFPVWSHGRSHSQRSRLSGDWHGDLVWPLPSSERSIDRFSCGKGQPQIGKLVSGRTQSCLGAWLLAVGKGHSKHWKAFCSVWKKREGWALEEDHAHAGWEHDWKQHRGGIHGKTCLSESWDWERSLDDRGQFHSSSKACQRPCARSCGLGRPDQVWSDGSQAAELCHSYVGQNPFKESDHCNWHCLGSSSHLREGQRGTTWWDPVSVFETY